MTTNRLLSGYQLATKRLDAYRQFITKSLLAIPTLILAQLETAYQIHWDNLGFRPGFEDWLCVQCKPYRRFAPGCRVWGVGCREDAFSNCTPYTMSAKGFKTSLSTRCQQACWGLNPHKECPLHPTPYPLHPVQA